jgi:pyruvate/2-oxoglutarate dehydrogenase complex dihydrolipoamide dehydrogenase (E3) component
METSMPGVFATGDVRHGAVKRVASAVGEGSIAIQTVHEYLSLRGAERSPMQTAGHTTETQASEDREMSIAAG